MKAKVSTRPGAAPPPKAARFTGAAGAAAPRAKEPSVAPSRPELADER